MYAPEHLNIELLGDINDSSFISLREHHFLSLDLYSSINCSPVEAAINYQMLARVNTFFCVYNKLLYRSNKRIYILDLRTYYDLFFQ